MNGKHEKLAELGETIRARRENLGLSVQEVQEKTKIRSKYLMAIEAGDDKIAPGKAYFRVFLKSYAEFLGLDGLEFSRIYSEVSENKNRYRPHAVDIPRTPSNERAGGKRRRVRRKKGMGWVVKALIALALLAAVGWGVARLYDHFLRSEDPGGIAAPENGNGTGKIGDDPESNEGNSTEEPTVGARVERSDPSEEVTVFKINQTPLKVTLETSPEEGTKCWIHVKADGETAMEKTMGPGETVDITAKNEIQVRAGKPWVLSLRLNGQDLGVGGPYGPVKDLIFSYDQEI